MDTALNQDLLLRVSGLSKSYAVPVLQDIELDVMRGEVHALIGANGAGKSTLARIIAGLTPPDRGKMQLAGSLYAPSHKAAAERSGVQIVHQELNLIGTLTVAENLFLSDLETRCFFIRRRRLADRARHALARVGLDDFDPHTLVSSLGIGQQQRVAIAKALAQSSRLLILDEPTAALTSPEIDMLFHHIGQLRDSGCSLIYISHRMDEIRQVADRVTVLRDGRVVATERVAATSVDRMVAQMVGQAAERATRSTDHFEGPCALEVSRLSCGPRVRDVSFRVKQAEVFGISGLVGSGRTELLRAIFGADVADKGAVRVGAAVPRRFIHPRQAVRAGLAMVPEDRQLDGLLLTQPIRTNATLNTLGRVARFRTWIDTRRETHAAGRVADAVQLQCHHLLQRANQLSGGNQQKVLVARWLLHDADVFLFDEPTRGIDVAAREAIYRLIYELAGNRKAVVVVSSDLDELMNICDRIGVMSAGRLVQVFARDEWSKHDLTEAAFRGYREPLDAQANE